MKPRRISASYVYTLTGKPLKNGIVSIDEAGIIHDIVDTGGELIETEGLEHYSGILCPGFVNAHCHLELSHLKGKIEEGLQLPDFLKQIFLLRNEEEAVQLKAMQQADRMMWLNGIVAIADVTNGSLSLEVKEQSNIFYHTFIECFGFLPERAPRAMEYAGFVGYLYDAAGLPYSITPHAPYSVSEELWELIDQKAKEKQHILSVHHQESEEEDRMFMDKSGRLIDHYTNNLKLDTNFWQPTKRSSTEKILEKISPGTGLLLVHNTFLDADKLKMVSENRSPGNTFFVTCPNANFYIEKRLPDYGLLRNSGFPVCIGTDSLASNRSLSILDEMKLISEKSSEIPLEELLVWACSNGAKAMKIDGWAGRIEKGKRPGLNLITGIDYKTMKLTTKSKVKKLI
jgi:cytosine/adenosine deaminase-related metal-dependent hydrolase